MKPVTLDNSPENLLRRYQFGLNLADIAQATRLKTWTICRRLRQLDPDYGRTARTWRDTRRRAALMYIKGNSTGAIARTYKVTPQTVGGWLRQMHPNYRQLLRRGVFASAAEFLNSVKAQKLTSEVERVERWLMGDLPNLLENEAVSDITSFDEAQERRLRYRECSRYNDYRQLF